MSGIFRLSHANALRLMPCDFIGDKSMLVQVMAWYRHYITASHYLKQC